MPTPIPRADTDIEDADSLAVRWLESILQPIASRLDRLFEAKKARASAAHPEAGALVDAVADLTRRGGKRLRPALVVGGYHAVAPSEDLDAVLDASIAVELLHTYLLIQDDWMDHDVTRRGGPAAHISLGERYKDAHRGNSAAILAADLASTYAWEALTTAPFTSDRLDPALAAFEEMQEEVVFGQLLDVLGAGEVETVHLYKTAGYTVRGPFRIGAHLAGAGPEVLESIDAFAKPLGLAFQLKDDLLGTFGDSEQTGKAAGNDLREGKRTAVIAVAQKPEAITPADRAVLDKVLGNREATEAQIAEVRSMLEVAGVRAKVEAELGRLYAEALEKLEASPIEERGKVLLKGLASLIVRRDR